MAVMHTPTVKGKATSKKVPTPKPTLVCSVGGCNFTCKYQKYMRDHEFDVHGKEPVKDPMDASVNASSLEDDPTPSKSSEEAKVHDSMENRPHSTLNMGASTSQDTGPSTDIRIKRGHSSDEDEDEGGDKKKQRDNEIEDEEEDALSQSPAAIERRRKQAEAKLSLEAFRQKKATEAIMAVLESDSDNSNGSQESGKANTSVNLLEETVANPAHPRDSLDLTNFDHIDAVENMEQTVAEDNMQLVRDAQEELAKRTKSLEDTLADRDTLRTQLALERKSKQVLENKLSRTKKELDDAVEVADGLRVAIADPSGGNSYELKKVRNELQAANNKAIRLTKELDRAKTLRKEALDQADTSRRLAQSWEQRIQQLEGEATLLKKQTNCNNRDCHDEKLCGRNHANKPENRANINCDFFMKGNCNKAENCPYKHDPEARDRHNHNGNRSNGGSNNTNNSTVHSMAPSGQQQPPTNNTSRNDQSQVRRNGRRRGRGDNQGNQGGERREESNQTNQSGNSFTGVGLPNNQPPQVSMPASFGNFSQPQQTFQQPAFQHNQANPPQYGQIGPINTNFGNQGIPPSFSNQSMMNNSNTWASNQASQSAVMAQNMTRLQKQEELRNELTSTRNMLTMAINSGQQPGTIQMEQLRQKELQLQSQLFQITNTNSFM